MKKAPKGAFFVRRGCFFARGEASPRGECFYLPPINLAPPVDAKSTQAGDMFWAEKFAERTARPACGAKGSPAGEIYGILKLYGNPTQQHPERKPTMYDILIVEDEAPIANLIRMSLTQAGYRCTIASDGDEGADWVERRRFDLILLDVMLPHTSGFELMEYIRQYDTPVIFLTARTEVRDRVKGLRLGAEDYIIKPFDVAELQARVEVVLRRYHKGGGKVTVGDITVDLDSRIVTRGGHPVDLTPKEFDILRLFLQNKNIALYRETIYERVWGEPFMGDTRTVDLHVQRLRHKLGWEKRIAAVYKVGYRYEENEP